MSKYLVTYKSKKGGLSGAGIFKTKGEAKKFILKTKKNKSFKKLGYSNLRVKLNV